MASWVIHHPWLAFDLLTNKQQLVNILFKLIRKSTLSVFLYEADACGSSYIRLRKYMLNALLSHEGSSDGIFQYVNSVVV